jgi:hypothetical protein
LQRPAFTPVMVKPGGPFLRATIARPDAADKKPAKSLPPGSTTCRFRTAPQALARYLIRA